MADEHISYRAMVNYEVGPMADTMQGRELGLRNDSTAPVVSGIGAKLARLGRCLADAFAAQRQREVDREISRLLGRSGGPITDSMERQIMRKVLASDWSPPL
jgi:hypothetical protein